MALWCPDWPVYVARPQAAATGPLAVMDHNRVWAACPQARRAGVRRGMRGRAAQAVLPTISLVPRDDARDARAFEPVIAALGNVAASVEALRPGLAVVDAAAAARFHGGEDKAAEMLINEAAAVDVAALAGIADDIPTAVIAARCPALVPAGKAAEFLAGQPLAVLAREEALGCDPHVVDTMVDLGIERLGQLAQLAGPDVHGRFGAAGLRCWRIARAATARKVAPAQPRPDLSVEFIPEEPLERVDSAAFAAKELAAQLHARLEAAGVVCRLLVVYAWCGDQELIRRWRTTTALTEKGTAQRVRWQLDNWLSSGGAGPLLQLRLEPAECGPPHPETLFGGAAAEQQSVRLVAHRVQAHLGVDKVFTPVPVGGRGIDDRIHLVPYGEQPPQPRPSAGPWHGAIPAPYPAVAGESHGRARAALPPTHPAAQVRLHNNQEQAVVVNSEALLSAEPAVLLRGTTRYRITGWAGPWPADERWWASDGRTIARLQIAGVDPQGQHRAWLLLWCAGAWRVEATYS